MNIYIPYTYLIGWSEYNKWYYGRRTAKNCNPKEFWVSYFTSSKYVEEFRKLHGEPDIIQIRKTFPNNPNSCKIWESKILEKLDVQHNIKFLNKKNGDNKWDTTGMISVKDSEGNFYSVNRIDAKYLAGELIPVTRGLIVVKNKEGKTFQVSTNDEKYLSGELIHHTKGLKFGKQSVEHKIKRITKESSKKSALSRTGLKQSEKTKTKRANSCSQWWEITNPQDKVYIIKNLNEFCRNNDLCSIQMGKVAKRSFATHKGWKCKKLSS